jgi:citronellol/citronellal dehydrogenase
MSFQNKTAFITGASRGIGKAIALKLAADGANVIVAAKSVEENPKLGGTIFTAAEEIENAGGKALAVQCDIRDEKQIQNAVATAVERFGRIDILVNNASAISLTPTEQTEVKRFDLMHDINVRGTFLACKSCIPHLKNGTNPHILTLSPPINLDPKWLKNHVAYTISKYSMTMMTIGLAEELRKYGIAANSLWPRTVIATAAVQNLLGGESLVKMSRKPAIVADAAYHILRKPSIEFTGNTCIDEDILLKEGFIDFDQYAVLPGAELYPDFFL